MSSSAQSAIHRLSSAGVSAALGILVLVTAGPLRAQTTAAAAEPAAPPLTFDLKDQFDRGVTQAVCTGRIAIVVVADREGSRFSGRWSQALGSGLKSAGAPATKWVGVATLPSLPGFMRGFVKGKFSQDKEQGTLLDWGGTLAQAYHLAPKCCHILVFGPDGRLRHHASGREVDPAAIAGVVAAVSAAGSGGRQR